jgi:NADH:ubiquinone oxidoreductase subunit E
VTSALAAIHGGRAWLRRSIATADDQMRVARRLAVASGAVVLVCTTALIVDHAIATWRAPAVKSRVTELEGQTKGDPEVAVTLHDERKQQTDASLGRETRGRTLAWTLLVAGGLFVASAKWVVSLRPQTLPSLDELVAVRSGQPERKGVRGKAERKESSAVAEPSAAPLAEAAEAVDLGFVDELIIRFGRDKESAIPILQAIQSHYRYLPDEVLRRVCERTDITPAQIAGTSSFYAQFRRSPVGRHVVRVCHGTACHVAGAEQITQELRRHLEIPPGADTDSERTFTLDAVACLGCCSLAPVMMIEDETAGRLTPATARQALDAVAKRGT